VVGYTPAPRQRLTLGWENGDPDDSKRGRSNLESITPPANLRDRMLAETPPAHHGHERNPEAARGAAAGPRAPTMRWPAGVARRRLVVPPRGARRVPGWCRPSANRGIACK